MKERGGEGARQACMQTETGTKDKVAETETNRIRIPRPLPPG